MVATRLLDNVSETFFVSACTVAAILIRWSVGAGPHSGMGKPPMFGDYEAQRHWQEITVNIPVQEWYKNTSDNNLLYWGLDYPPLTAYHSWAIGKIALLIDPDWVSLHISRGIESYHHKIFMRYTVLIADILLFFPAFYLAMKNSRNHQVNREAYLIGLLYPGLILIDYGHFQYNNISLGLFLLAAYFLGKNHVVMGSVAFCLSLNYKQMELYHSLPFFFFLLGKSLESGFFRGLFKVAKLGVTVIATFAVCWLPFLGSMENALAVVSRLFPVNRGLYEDKVANFWCSVAPVIKLKDLVSSEDAIRMCIAATLLASLPSGLHVLRRPTVKAFRFSCVVVPLAFFLFSYQVHEKSILIPAVSACLIYSESPFLVSWFFHISTFSMLPLLQKDGLMLQYYVTRFMCLLLTYATKFEAAKPSISLVKLVRTTTCNVLQQGTVGKILQLMVFCSIVVTEIFSFLLMLMKPPERYPDLWPVAISAISCIHFVLFLVLFTTMQFRLRTQSVPDSKKQS